MIVHVDPASPVPVFEQLRGQIERLVVTGILAPGAALPTIRDLATDLGLARGTVARVYDELARDGLVETRGRHGTRVLGPGRRQADAGELDAAGHAALEAAQRRLGPARAGSRAVPG